jgi:hypothetical protein
MRSSVWPAWRRGSSLAWTLTSITPSFFLGRTLSQIDIDTRALLVASCLGIASVLLAGPSSRPGSEHAPMRSAASLLAAGRAETPSSASPRSLLVVEIALACSLLVGSAAPSIFP